MIHEPSRKNDNENEQYKNQNRVNDRAGKSSLSTKFAEKVNINTRVITRS